MVNSKSPAMHPTCILNTHCYKSCLLTCKCHRFLLTVRSIHFYHKNLSNIDLRLIFICDVAFRFLRCLRCHLLHHEAAYVAFDVTLSQCHIVALCHAISCHVMGSSPRAILVNNSTLFPIELSTGLTFLKWKSHTKFVMSWAPQCVRRSTTIRIYPTAYVCTPL